MFNSYDRNRSGFLEPEELQACLADLGLLVRPAAAAVPLWAPVPPPRGKPGGAVLSGERAGLCLICRGCPCTRAVPGRRLCPPLGFCGTVTLGAVWIRDWPVRVCAALGPRSHRMRPGYRRRTASRWGSRTRRWTAGSRRPTPTGTGAWASRNLRPSSRRCPPTRRASSCGRRWEWRSRVSFPPCSPPPPPPTPVPRPRPRPRPSPALKGAARRQPRSEKFSRFHSAK